MTSTSRPLHSLYPSNRQISLLYYSHAYFPLIETLAILHTNAPGNSGNDNVCIVTITDLKICISRPQLGCPCGNSCRTHFSDFWICLICGVAILASVYEYYGFAVKHMPLKLMVHAGSSCGGNQFLAN